MSAATASYTGTFDGRVEEAARVRREITVYLANCPVIDDLVLIASERMGNPRHQQRRSPHLGTFVMVTMRDRRGADMTLQQRHAVIAANIRALRQLHGWTQARLDELMGWASTSTVCAAEGHRGDRQRAFTTEEVQRLAAIFGISPWQLTTQCVTCSGDPPAGFACLTCGTGTGPAHSAQPRPDGPHPMIKLPAPEDVERLLGFLKEQPRWSAFWDKIYGVWRVAEDDPDSALYAESPDVEPIISYITANP